MGGREGVRQTDRQRVRQTDRQRVRQRDRERGRERAAVLRNASDDISSVNGL